MKKPDYILDGQIPVAIIYRKNEKSQTEPCPFCGCSHSHGVPDGFRVPHCIVIHKRGIPIYPKENIVSKDGTELLKEFGYYVKTNPEIKSIFDTKN